MEQASAGAPGLPGGGWQPLLWTGNCAAPPLLATEQLAAPRTGALAAPLQQHAPEMGGMRGGRAAAAGSLLGPMGVGGAALAMQQQGDALGLGLAQMPPVSGANQFLPVDRTGSGGSMQPPTGMQQGVYQQQRQDQQIQQHHQQMLLNAGSFHQLILAQQPAAYHPAGMQQASIPASSGNDLLTVPPIAYGQQQQYSLAPGSQSINMSMPNEASHFGAGQAGGLCATPQQLAASGLQSQQQLQQLRGFQRYDPAGWLPGLQQGGYLGLPAGVHQDGPGMLLNHGSMPGAGPLSSSQSLQQQQQQQQRLPLGLGDVWYVVGGPSVVLQDD